MVRPSPNDVCPLRVSGLSSSSPQAHVVYPCNQEPGRVVLHHIMSFGLVWSGLDWSGLVWFGLVWFGLVFVLFCFVFIRFALLVSISAFLFLVVLCSVKCFAV